MISAQEFYDHIIKVGIDFITGVPDSLLKEFCLHVQEVHPQEKHVIAANEGSAVAIGAGWHLATGNIPLVYLQNSGFGNSINPLVSLMDPSVYAIPVLLLIGWRGEPGINDEPQHIKQGEITPAILEILGIPYEILDGSVENSGLLLDKMVCSARQRSGPSAILVKKNTFIKNTTDIVKIPCNQLNLTREIAIKIITNVLPKNTIVVATTGFTSRELYEVRKANQESDSKDFLTVGSMGHASQIAFGIAKAQKENLVVCLDGDGAALMHLGGLATIGSQQIDNYLHILLNNGVHDSVGGQPTVGFDISFIEIAKACGFKTCGKYSKGEKEISAAVNQAVGNKGPGFIEIILKPGARHDLGRPDTDPLTNKTQLMKYFKNCD